MSDFRFGATQVLRRNVPGKSAGRHFLFVTGSQEVSGALGEIRTPDPQIRSLGKYVIASDLEASLTLISTDNPLILAVFRDHKRSRGSKWKHDLCFHGASTETRGIAVKLTDATMRRLTIP